MKIEVIRKYFNEEYTIGKMYLNGKYFCDTIEDCDRGLNQSMSEAEIEHRKKYGITAIPYGVYNVTLTMSAKFKRILPAINSVKGYEGVRIHAGNTAKDSLGCILVGENKIKGQVINSRTWENKLMAELTKAKNKHEQIKLTITK